jgi:hypothetical protein
MLATGELGRDDEVSVVDDSFQPIGEIDELSRHLLPSTTATTSVLFEPGVPDYHVTLRETPMLHVLARMRRSRETGGIFVQRRDGDRQRRKEIYLQDGRLYHVASSDRAELLGEYLVRRGVLERSDLDAALAVLATRGGRLGDTLISMGAVQAVDVFRSIRDQGRDRVATVCTWRSGSVTFYRNAPVGSVEFPLDLDLASPMMAGVILLSRDPGRSMLPKGDFRLKQGHRARAAEDARERGTAPFSLQLVPRLVQGRENLTVDAALEYLTRERKQRGARTIGIKEARAALVVAQLLGWVDFEPPSAGSGA